MADKDKPLGKSIGGIPVPSLADVENAKINTDLVTTTDLDNDTRATSAVALRVAGAPYTKIAEVLGYSNGFQARLAVERALAQSVDSDDSREQLRFLEARRLERLLQAVWGKAGNEKHPEQMVAVRTALAIIDRHARLYGLDAPQQMVVHTPKTLEIQQWVMTMAQQVVKAPVEADVIDVEFTDG